MSNHPAEYAETLEDQKASIRRAQEAGLIVNSADPYVLQLDLDSLAAYEKAYRLVQHFERDLAVNRVVRTRSKGGEGFHLYVHLSSALPLEDRIAWQAFLGSDRVREALAWKFMRAHPDAELEPFLFEKPNAETLDLTNEMLGVGGHVLPPNEMRRKIDV